MQKGNGPYLPKRSVGVPVELESSAVAMLRLVLEEYLGLSHMRHIIAQRAAAILSDSTDAQRLMTNRAIGPATALTILAEAGDLRRFPRYRQFLTFLRNELVDPAIRPLSRR